MIDLLSILNHYSVCVVKKDRQIFIEEIVTSVSWGGAVGTAARKLTVNCMRHPDAEAPVECGDIIILHREDEDKEIIRGIVVDKSVSSGGKSESYTVYDARWWLLRSKHDKIFRNMTATEIVTTCCKEFGVPTGSMVDTGVKFPDLQFVNKTAWDTIIIALTETRKVNGKKYTTKMVKGKLSLIERVQRTHQWVIEEGANLLDSTYTESIADTYTQVLVVGKNNSKTGLSVVAKSDALIEKYGVLQERIEQTEAKSQSELNAIAAQKLKELAVLKKSGSITAIGLDDVEAGDGIYVIDSTTGLIGGFWVASDDHTVSNKHHTMTLQLSWTDELPSIDYEPPDKKK